MREQSGLNIGIDCRDRNKMHVLMNTASDSYLISFLTGSTDLHARSCNVRTFLRPWRRRDSNAPDCKVNIEGNNKTRLRIKVMSVESLALSAIKEKRCFSNYV